MNNISAFLERILFAHRIVVIALFVVITAVMLYFTTQLRIDAGFTKLLPMKHEYMQTFSKHQQSFGGANRILIALMVKEGDIFNKPFFDHLAAVTDEVFFIPGVDRTRVTSLFTPNVRFTEVVEDGISGGNVIPADFEPSPEGLQQVRQNIIKAGIVGRLVANDFSGALISVQLQEFNPQTGEPLNYIEVADQLESKIRQKYQNDNIDISLDIHLIGFAKAVGDIANGSSRVVMFFAIAFFITALLAYANTRSIRLTTALLSSALIAVVWQLGLLPILGYGIDPMSVLIPFLVFAIAISHGVQMVSNQLSEIAQGKSPEMAARTCFRRLLIPSSIALASDTLGFITIYLIEIRVIQEMAITASLGIAVIILSNLLLLPILISYIRPREQQMKKLQQRAERMKSVWRVIARAATTRASVIIIALSLLLTVVGGWKALEVSIGDLQRGVPELRTDAQYNIDTQVIAEKFSIGVDVLTVIVETSAEGCIKHSVMSAIDNFQWHMQNVAGVQSVVAMPGIAKTINAGWNEGAMKWRVLPRNESALAQSVSYIPTSSGLLNTDCSVMPVLIFTDDHKATTIHTIVTAVKNYREQHPHDEVTFLLATGNVGVMAATNEEIERAQFPILFYLFSAIFALCVITFRSISATLCIMLPLGLVSLLAYALMAIMDIGLKVATLPVVALGVGVGVDYGIYIYSRLREFMATESSLYEAYWKTLCQTGSGVLFTAITLAIGLTSWIFSPLKFQADMGILLTFMFLVNMLGAIFLLPALVCWFKKMERKASQGQSDTPHRY
jgi:predicted RND superfamily exporter protein